MVTIQTEHFSAVKFYMGYLWEKYELPCDTKISKKFEKKSLKDMTGVF